MATRPQSIWDRIPGVTGVRAAWQAMVKWLDQDRIFGKSILWFVSGWRLGLILLVLAIIFPQEYNDSYIITAISIGAYVLLALGLNIVVGYAGLLDLGYVAFFVIGAYTCAVLTGGEVFDSSNTAHFFTPYSLWLVLPLGALLAGVAGVLLGWPTLRLRGDYLAIVTLGFGEIAHVFFLNATFFGKSNGLTSGTAPVVNLPILGTTDFGNFRDHTAFFYLMLAAVVIIVLFVNALRNSSLGRAWIAIREDETAAAASGVNLVRTKLLAFGTGAAIGGLGGVLYAATNTSIDPDQFVFGVSITILVMIVLGGVGSIAGVILGATLLKLFDGQLLGPLNNVIHNSGLVAANNAPLHFLSGADFKFLTYGLVLLIMVLLRPQGIIPDRRRQRELKQASSVESASAVGALAIEEAGEAIVGIGAEDTTEYVGPGSDAQGREE